jgi:beta-lactamase regulating signal transducer with metallopeptidase domain
MLLHAVLWNALLATFLAAVTALVGRTNFFRRRPAVMHLLWFAILVKLLVPPLVPIPFLPSSTVDVRPAPVPRSPVGRVASFESHHVLESPAVEPVDRAAVAEWSWQPDLPGMLLALSVAGTAVFLARFLWLNIRVGRLLRTADAAPERLVLLAADLAARLDVSPVPSVRVVDACITPVLWLRRHKASIVIPRPLADALDDDQMTCILSHELAHLVRHDRAFNLVALAVVALCWWHPVAWWARRQMQARQEECCDALAIARLSRSRRLYAQTLLRALDFLQTSLDFGVLASPGFGNRSHLARRFEMIANSSVRPNCSLGAVVLLALGAASFVCLPVRAEPPSADSAKDGKQVFPKPLDKPETIEEMHESVRNLGELGIALHDWADAHHSSSGSTSSTSSSGTTSTSSSTSSTSFRFPPAVIYGKDGKGKYPHSWRVELLPYLGARDLCDEYHFDEPWDSKANTIVLYKRAAVFRNPADDPDSIYSGYFALVGRLVDEKTEGTELQTFFSCKTGVEINHITDGTGDTIAIVEAKRKIPWTKPEDIPYDPAKKPPQLGGFFEGGFCVGFADGSAHFVAEPIKDAALKALISPAAGDHSDYKFQRLRIPRRRGHISAK